MKSLEVFAFASLFVGHGIATDRVLTPEGLAAKIQTAELERNLWNLDRIGKENGGHRAFGSPGYKASSDYILERAKTRFGPEYDTTVQNFNHLYNEVLEISVTGPEGESVDVISLIYNPGTDDGPIKAPLIDTPVDDVRGSGCFADQWEGIDATGKLALVKRGLCALTEKIKLAKAHGAVGVLIYHNLPSKPSSATLTAESYGLLVPVGTIPLAVGTAWKERLAAGEELVVELYIEAIFEDRTTWNIIAETKQGDPNNVVMLGAHLDSVQAGPGVNDDGSGTSVLLEIMTELRYYEGYPNKVRFAWWGAEESGLVGSLYYTETLTPEEADKIRFYFNFDMVGSPYPAYQVYIGDNEADEFGASKLLQSLKAAGKDANYANFGTSSDYVGFLELGIPSSGIFTGASATTDPCYHIACDTVSNVNLDALTVNAKAAASAVAEFALSLDGVPRRKDTSLNPRGKNAIRSQFLKWKRAAATAATQKSCSLTGDNRI